MLKGKLIHPDILRVLGRAGHSSKLLIADGNYPFGSRLGPRAELVSLNLAPGLVSVTDVLDALLSAIPIEAAYVMDYPTEGDYALDGDPPIWSDFRRSLDAAGAEEVELEKLERFDFYTAAGADDVVLTVATGDQRIYANLMLQIGVVFPR